MDRIKLGQEVKDIITGYRGIAISQTHFLQGCSRIEVQAPVGEDGKIPDVGCFDEPQLVVIGDGVLKSPNSRDNNDNGGPHRGLNPSRPHIRSR